MFVPHKVLIEAFTGRLTEQYRAMFSNQDPDVPGILRWASWLALETIRRGDAPYHDLEHTLMVTQVGAAMLEGRQYLDGGVGPRDWLNAILALLCHDVGYVRGLLPLDRADAVDRGDGTVVPMPPGATGARLAPYHVDRGQAFIRRRFGQHPIIDVEQVCANIEHTRFPVPDMAAEAAFFPALVRAADLVGQLADPGYLRKTAALYAELAETGVAEALGYSDPDDLRRKYPSFYATQVYPHVHGGLRCLSATYDGRQWLAHLHSQLFLVENALDFRYG